MLIPHRAIGTAVYAIAVIVVIAAAAGAYVFLIAPGAGGSSSTTSTSSSETSSSSSSQASTTSSPSTSTTGPASTSSGGTTTVCCTTTTSTSTQTSTYHTTFLSTSTTSLPTSTTTFTTSTGTTCTTTTGTTASFSQAAIFNFSQTFAEYSEMAVHFNGTENGQSIDASYNYRVVLTTATTYKVNVNMTTGGSTLNFVDYVLKNGTAVAVNFFGTNYTGSSAFTYYLDSMAAFSIGNIFGASGVFGQFQSSDLVHETGSSVVMIGPTQVSVTDYVANSLPIVESTCGSSVNFNKFSIQIGNVTGASVQLLTDLQISGSITSPGLSQSMDLSLHMTSVTKAA